MVPLVLVLEYACCPTAQSSGTPMVTFGWRRGRDRVRGVRGRRAAGAVAPPNRGPHRDKALASRSKRYMNKARSHYMRALKIREKQRPPHPPDVAESLLNLGHLMLDARLFGPARGYLERALRLDGTPPVPPDIRAKISRLLGLLSRDQGRLHEARAHLSESVRMYEAAYGPDHPFTKEARRLSQLPHPPS